MTSDKFQGLLLREVDGAITATVETLQTSDLPDGDVTVRVEYSDLNYKDGMATIRGNTRGRLVVKL
jgi:acrylyl-CoA reductase (NADPH)